MKKYLTYAMVLLLLVYIAGCVASGTTIVIYDIDEFISSSSGMEVVEVDLTTNEDYNDNKDKIKSIDQVTVTGTLANLESDTAQAEIWLAHTDEYTDPDTVREYAVRVFVSPSIPGNSAIFINWSDGLSHIENLGALKDAADGGHFWLYGLAENSPFTVRFKITLVITMTAGL